MFRLLIWALPSDPIPSLVEIAALSLQMLPRILIFVHCHTMARYFGANGFGALMVSVIPLGVQWAVSLSLHQVHDQVVAADAARLTRDRLASSAQ